MASQTFNLGPFEVHPSFIRYLTDGSSNFSMNAEFVENTPSYLTNVILFIHGAFGISFEATDTFTSNARRDLRASFEATGVIILQAGERTLRVTGFGDATEPYSWTPSNSDEVIAFHNDYNNEDISITFDDDPAAAPSFDDDTGSAQSWTVGTAITAITVPAADGTPTPTYAAVGALPAGLSFNATTRVLSGTPTAAGSGTITIRATNSAGMDDWTVAYTTVAALVAPAFVDDTGDAQDWTVGTAITEITVPVATGNPTPTYAAVGALPGGISFNATTRALSGTPTVVGSGTITIRATNSAGTDDWTVAYTTVAAVPLLALSDFDDAGLDLVAAALLEASAPGSSGSTPYADSDRGGTDTPLDGELGLSDSETVISRISHVAGAILRLNDNDNPVLL